MHLPFTLVGSLFHIPLNADFGHAPLGRLGKRSAQAVPPGAPRLADATDQLKVPGSALGSRLLNRISPANTRLPARTLEALTDSSKQVAELLGQICDAPAHRGANLALKKLLHSFAATAAPLTFQGADLLEVLRHRVEVHALHMTAAQLLVLRDGLVRARLSPDITQPAVIQQLAVIRDVVHRALAAHAQTLLAHMDDKMWPALQKALDQLPHEAAHPDAVAQQFALLLGIAHDLLQAQGYGLHAPKVSAAMQRELVQAFCSQAVHNAAISHDQLCALLQALPPQQQVELGQTTQQVLRTVPSPFLQALQQASQQWLQETRQRLHHADQALTVRPALRGNALAEQVIGIATALHQLRSYFAARGERFDPALNEGLVTDFRELEATLLKPEHLPLAALDHRLLHDLGLSMKRMNMEATAQRTALAIRQRQAVVDAPYVRAMHALAEALRSGDFTSIFDHLSEAADRRAQAAGVYQQLGTPLANAGQAMAFREDRMRTAVQQWDRATLLALRMALDQPTACAVTTTLEQLGNELLQGVDQPEDANALLGRLLLDTHIDFQLLRQTVVTQLGQQGIRPPEIDRAAYGPADLDENALAAFRARFGLALRMTGPALQVTVQEGMARHAVQTLFLDHLHSLTPTASTAPSQRVAAAFWQDLASADYQIRLPNGALRPLLDQAALAKAQDPALRTHLLEQAVTDLDALLGHNPDLLMRVTALANHRLRAGVQLGLQSSDSPVHMPDGQRGSLTGGKDHLSYVIACDKPGAATLQFHMHTTQATHFLPSSAAPILQSVDPHSSHFATWCKLRIDQDLGLSTQVPLQFSFHASPLVLTTHDLLHCGNRALQASFARFTEQRYVSESWNLLSAYYQFLQQPSLAGAQALVQRFIGEQAPEQVNISGQLESQVKQASNLDSQVHMLGKVAAELRTMLDQGGLVKDFLQTQAHPATQATAPAFR